MKSITYKEQTDQASHRKIDEPVVDDLAKVGDGCVQQGGRRLHFDGIGDLADLQFHVDGRLLLDLEREGAA